MAGFLETKLSGPGPGQPGSRLHLCHGHGVLRNTLSGPKTVVFISRDATCMLSNEGGGGPGRKRKKGYSKQKGGLVEADIR
jgi:hypothetical protein